MLLYHLETLLRIIAEYAVLLRHISADRGLCPPINEYIHGSVKFHTHKKFSLNIYKYINYALYRFLQISHRDQKIRICGECSVHLFTQKYTAV